MGPFPTSDNKASAPRTAACVAKAPHFPRADLDAWVARFWCCFVPPPKAATPVRRM